MSSHVQLAHTILEQALLQKTSFWSADEYCIVQLNSQKLYLNFKLLRIRRKQSVKTTEIQPNCERNATAAA